MRPAKKIRVGQEFVYNYMLVNNISDEPITVLKIEPDLSHAFGNVAQIQISLGRSSLSVPWGRFLSYPPVFRNHRGACEGIAIRDPKDHPRLEVRVPHSLIIRIRTQGMGSGRLRSVNVIYQSDGRRYQQTIPFEIRLNVARQAPALKARTEEKACAPELGSDLLLKL